MNKDKFEAMCAKAGLQPVMRGTTSDGQDFFIADGFSEKPARDFRKFGGTQEEFPGGAYGTLWLIARGEDRVVGGGMCLFDLAHDTGLSARARKEMRINAAKEKAEQYLEHVRNVNAR